MTFRPVSDLSVAASVRALLRAFARVYLLNCRAI
jgi:hypothetical protein